MKKCHFSILYNELPFLKQKMEFLYSNFDQLIFYDLNVASKTPHFSTDGSHEYIKEYPDPENKITLIEKKDLSDVNNYQGGGSIPKRQMFSVGSSYVRDEIESFWCFDLDEFFDKSLLEKTDVIFNSNNQVNTIDVDHLVFFKNENTLISESVRPWKMFCRIARHKPGNVYGHCTLNKQYPKTHLIQDEVCYHFGWVGDKRVKSKMDHYIEMGGRVDPGGKERSTKMYYDWYNNFWSKYDDYKDNIIEGSLYSSNAHPNKDLKCGLHRYTGTLPNYINVFEMMEDLNK